MANGWPFKSLVYQDSHTTLLSYQCSVCYSVTTAVAFQTFYMQRCGM